MRYLLLPIAVIAQYAIVYVFLYLSAFFAIWFFFKLSWFWLFIVNLVFYAGGGSLLLRVSRFIPLVLKYFKFSWLAVIVQFIGGALGILNYFYALSQKPPYMIPGDSWFIVIRYIIEESSLKSAAVLIPTVLLQLGLIYAFSFQLVEAKLKYDEMNQMN